MTQKIKEKVLKEWDKFWWANKDRLFDDSDGLIKLDSSVNSKISFNVGVSKTLAEVGKVIDDLEHIEDDGYHPKEKVVNSKELKKELGIK